MKKEKIDSEIAIHCGNNSDSFETLGKLCTAEAEKLLPTIEVPDDKIICVPCWTNGYGFSEFICYCEFGKGMDGTVRFDLDFSECTL